MREAWTCSSAWTGWLEPEGGLVGVLRRGESREPAVPVRWKDDCRRRQGTGGPAIDRDALALPARHGRQELAACIDQITARHDAIHDAIPPARRNEYEADIRAVRGQHNVPRAGCIDYSDRARRMV